MDASKIAELVPGFQPQWTVPEGVDELYRAFTEYGTAERRTSWAASLRIRWLLAAQQAGRVTRRSPLGR